MVAIPGGLALEPPRSVASRYRRAHCSAWLGVNVHYFSIQSQAELEILGEPGGAVNAKRQCVSPIDRGNRSHAWFAIYAAMAEFEPDQISARTKAALAQAKARGVVLGRAGRDNLRSHTDQQREASRAFADRLRGIFEGFDVRGLSQRQMVAELNAAGIRTPNGSAWRLTQVQRVKQRLSERISSVLD